MQTWPTKQKDTNSKSNYTDQPPWQPMADAVAGITGSRIPNRECLQANRIINHNWTPGLILMLASSNDSLQIKAMVRAGKNWNQWAMIQHDWHLPWSTMILDASPWSMPWRQALSSHACHSSSSPQKVGSAMRFLGAYIECVCVLSLSLSICIIFKFYVHKYTYMYSCTKLPNWCIYLHGWSNHQVPKYLFCFWSEGATQRWSLMLDDLVGSCYTHIGLSIHIGTGWAWP